MNIKVKNLILKSSKKAIKNLKGTVSKLARECVESRDDFSVKVVDNSQMYWPRADAETNSTDMLFSLGFCNQASKREIDQVVTHELTHAANRITNENLCGVFLTGAPYCNAGEFNEYSEVLNYFNKDLDKLETRLNNQLKKGSKPIDLDDKDRAIVEGLYKPIIANPIYDPYLLSLKKGANIHSNVNGEFNKQFPITLREQPYESKDPNGSRSITIQYKFDDPIAHSLATIYKYKDTIRHYPKDRIDSEQPAYMLEDFDLVLPYVSKEMTDFLSNRFEKCTHAERLEKSKANLAQEL